MTETTTTETTTTEPEFNFRDHVSEPYKDKYTEFKTVDDVFKGYEGLVTKLGTNPLVVPKEGASDEEKAAFKQELNKINGVPESADKYDIQLPELPEGFINDEVFGQMKQVLHENGVGSQQANDIINKYVGMQLDAYNKASGDNEAKIVETESALKKEWGNDYENNINQAKQFYQLHMKDVDPATAEKYGNDLDFIKMIHGLSAKVQEDRIDTVSPVASSPADIQSLRNKMVELQSKPEYRDIHSEGHQRVNDEVMQVATKIAELQNKVG